MQLFTDNASSTLAAGISTSSTSITLASGWDRFPNPQGSDYFLATLYQRVGMTEQNWEIVLCTARNGATLTIQRAKNGTTAFAFNQGDFIELRLVADSVLPVRAGSLTGPLNEANIVPIASSSAMAIGVAGGNTIEVSGNATINTFDSVGSGAVRRMTFTGSPTLTYNATSMKLITGASIAAKPGDWCEWVSLGGGNWQMMNYTRADGASLTQQNLVAGANVTITANGNNATIAANVGNYATSLKFL